MKETSRYLNVSCFSNISPTWREHWFGCLDRHVVSVWVVLIFIPVKHHESENLSRAFWRSFWVESNSTKPSANNRRYTVQSPIFTPPQDPIFLIKNRIDKREQPSCSITPTLRSFAVMLFIRTQTTSACTYTANNSS